MYVRAELPQWSFLTLAVQLSGISAFVNGRLVRYHCIICGNLAFMIFSDNTRGKLFNGFAVLLALVAIYHFIGVLYKVDDTPVWRHLLFAGINIFCIYGVLKRPDYFIYFFRLLLVQQYYSHGSYMIKIWQERKQIHWISVLDLLLLPVAFICLIEDHKVRHSKKLK